MQLTLPSRVEPIGTLVLERGAQAGRSYRFETSVCKNPVCQCEHVTLYFLADSPQLEPTKEAGRPVLASLELDLAKRRIHDLKTLEANTTAAAMGKAVVGEMLDRDWDGLQRLYVGLKHYYTEHADLDAIEAEFPEDATEGLTVGYYEILPYALPVEFTCDNREWVMDDQYCAMPKCSCHYAVMASWPLHCAGDHNIAPREPAATVRYDYRSGGLENLSDTKKQSAGVSAIFETFKRAKPDLNSFLARRHAALRHLFRCAINRKRPPVQTPKPARNAPCPCGSGKKYKRCCGAPSGKTSSDRDMDCAPTATDGFSRKCFAFPTAPPDSY